MLWGKSNRRCFTPYQLGGNQKQMKWMWATMENPHDCNLHHCFQQQDGAYFVSESTQQQAEGVYVDVPASTGALAGFLSLLWAPRFETAWQENQKGRKTRRMDQGEPAGKKMSREWQIMVLISGPPRCCLDASTSFEAFSQNPSLKYPILPPTISHSQGASTPITSTHLPKKTPTTLPLTLTLPSPLGSHQQYWFADRSTRLNAVCHRSNWRSGGHGWSHIGKSQLGGQRGLCLCRWKLRRMRTCP